MKEAKRTEDKIQKISKAGNDSFKTLTDTTRKARQENKERTPHGIRPDLNQELKTEWLQSLVRVNLS